ncbi:MAG TPA: hypothetical protein VGA95_12170 [Thermodesulfobacteriota bacterium]
MIEDFLLDDFDVGNILGKLSEFGAFSIRILIEDFRLCLLKEAESYIYRSEQEIVGRNDKIVIQQMSTFEEFPGNSKFYNLKIAFQALLEDCLKNLKPYPFHTRLLFNSMSLQRYEKGSIGITPHRDGFKYKNLISNFNIDGGGRFFTCTDRSGKGSCEIPFPPGSVLLMRAPGFLGSDERPFHYVSDIQGTRYVFGLRQKVPYD